MQYLSRCFTATATSVVMAMGAPLAASATPNAASSTPEEQVAMRHGGLASVGGLWCGAGLLNEFTLEIAQQLDDVRGKLVRKGRVREITGQVEGTRLKVDPQRDHTMELLAEGNQLRITAATGMLALATGQSFIRASGGSCTR
jgi:hypothetical protein